MLQQLINKFQISKVNTSYKYVLLVPFCVVLLAIVYYFYLKQNEKKEQYRENNERIGNENLKNVELLFFHVDWCPYCKTAKPEWNNIKELYENNTINGRSINFIEIDCTNESNDTKEMMDKYTIEGYPTVKLIKDGNVFDFDAKPTKENIENFLQSFI